jgi:hypothetical protein
MLLKLSVSLALMFFAFVKDWDSNFHRNTFFAILFASLALLITV